eukprot:TRINITY_DN533_c0_g1_i2.p1 TRINITY_DN533_c0_g1~~TRINITY_DN533_c0_g1_i2.p1  ORF type:complete len:1260 (-),score=356.95 TRINITY_DN533_c0_g1_i2:532-4311(-)
MSLMESLSSENPINGESMSERGNGAEKRCEREGVEEKEQQNMDDKEDINRGSEDVSNSVWQLVSEQAPILDSENTREVLANQTDNDVKKEEHGQCKGTMHKFLSGNDKEAELVQDKEASSVGANCMSSEGNISKTATTSNKKDFEETEEESPQPAETDAGAGNVGSASEHEGLVENADKNLAPVLITNADMLASNAIETAKAISDRGVETVSAIGNASTIEPLQELEAVNTNSPSNEDIHAKKDAGKEEFIEHVSEIRNAVHVDQSTESMDSDFYNRENPLEVDVISTPLETKDDSGKEEFNDVVLGNGNAVREGRNIERTILDVHKEDNIEDKGEIRDRFRDNITDSENKVEIVEEEQNENSHDHHENKVEIVEEAQNENSHDHHALQESMVNIQPELKEINMQDVKNFDNTTSSSEKGILCEGIAGEERSPCDSKEDSYAKPVKEHVYNGREQKPSPDSSDSDSAEAEREAEAEAEEPISTEPTRNNVASSNTSTSYSGVSLPARPAGLGRAAPLLEPAPRATQHSRANGNSAIRTTQFVAEQNIDDTENSETREKLQAIRVKFLRLAHRLGQTPHNVVVAQVLYRLGLAEQLRGSRASNRTGGFSFDRASAIAEQLEAAGQEGLDFTCNIMVLGKTGVGKSATINSIFDEAKSGTDAFQVGTQSVQEIVGTVQGIKVRVIDTPGLLPSFADQRYNEKILKSVKRFTDKSPPDIVLYFDRLDMQCRDFGDLPLLRTITAIFGSTVWFNAIVVLTHAASAPPDGPNGTPLSYEMFVAQRSHVVQQAIRQAAADLRLMNPVSLVENHSACRTNRAGQRVLPNGQIWKPQLLLLCFASKILAEANTLLKLQDSPSKPFGFRTRSRPLPFLLSTLLQSRQQPTLPEEQYGDDDVSDEDLEESSDMDEEDDFDILPPFRHLSKAELSKLSKKEKKDYFDELKYREKLFMKKQVKLERQRRRWMKKMTKDKTKQNDDDGEEQQGGNTVPVPMPDMALPPTFDSDNPVYRYRCLEANNQWFVRPVLDSHGWDHDVGYEGVNVEKTFVIREKIPVSISGQVTKDKRDTNLQIEGAASYKHGEGKVSLLGLDVQTVGKDLASTIRAETRFNNFQHNKTTTGIAVTLLGDCIAGGVKIEDKLVIGKRFKLLLNAGAITGQGDMTYGGSLECTLRGQDYPLSRFLTTLGISVMDWHGDIAVGGNLQCQMPVGQHATMIARANLNNRGAGQFSVRISSSEHLSLALVGMIPIFKALSSNGLFGLLGSSD